MEREKSEREINEMDWERERDMERERKREREREREKEREWDGLSERIEKVLQIDR